MLLTSGTVDYTEAVNDFLEYARTIRGYSETTLSNYRAVLRRFAEQQSLSCISEITLELIEKHSVEMRKRGNGTDSIYNTIVTVRAFLRYLNRRTSDVLDHNLIDVPKRKVRTVNALTIEEVQKIIDNMHRERDKLMALILFTSGVRVNELTGLKVEDIDGTQIKVIGKGDKPRLCFVHEYVAQRIMIYASMRDIRSGYLFTNKQGYRLGTEAVRYAIRHAAKRAGITRQVYPHLFRHAFAVQMLQNGMDVRTVQTLMGHDQIQTTMRYLNVTDQWKKEQYELAKPKIVLTNPADFARIGLKVDKTDAP